MLIYIVFILLASLGVIFFDTKQVKDTKEKFFFWSLCIYLVLMVGLSRELGGDKQMYWAFFEDINSGFSIWTYVLEQFEDKSFMPLWSMVNYLSMKWFNSFIPVQIVEGLVINTAACYIAYKYTNRHFLFILIYFISGIFFQLNTEVMREGFAIGLGLIALDSYLEKKWITYVVFTAIAILFHLSALILLLFPIITIFKFNFNWKLLLVCLAVSFSIWLVSDIMLTHIFPKLNFLPTILLDKLAHYFNEGASIMGYIGLVGRYIIIPFIIDYFVLNAATQEDTQHKIQQYMIFQIVIGTFICSTGWSFTRFANYSCVYYMIWISTFITLIITQRKYVILKICCLLFVAGFQVQRFLIYYPENNAHFYDFFVPYTSVFDNIHPKTDRMVLYFEACPPQDNIAARQINN